MNLSKFLTNMSWGVFLCSGKGAARGESEDQLRRRFRGQGASELDAVFELLAGGASPELDKRR
jgi:hypothetical protein